MTTISQKPLSYRFETTPLFTDPLKKAYANE